MHHPPQTIGAQSRCSDRQPVGIDKASIFILQAQTVEDYQSLASSFKTISKKVSSDK